MEFEIVHQPAHSMAIAKLEAGESLRAEAGAMVTMDPSIEVDTQSARRAGGLFKGLKKKFLTGETFFTNTFIAKSGPGSVMLAPSLCGDLVVHNLEATTPLLIQGSSYVAAPDSVNLDTKFQGFTRGLLSGETFFFLKATGTGPVVLNAFGGIETIDLDGELIVDTGHLLALTAGLHYEVTKNNPGWIASFLSGEGFVLHVRGQGKLYLQTRNPAEYGKVVGRHLKARKE